MNRRSHLRRQHRRHRAGLLAAPPRLHPPPSSSGRRRLRAGGYKIDIRGAALDVVERMGILDRGPRGRAPTCAARRCVDGDGSAGRAHGRRHLRRPAATRDVEILRGDLNPHPVRADRATTSSTVFDDSIAGLHEDARRRASPSSSGDAAHLRPGGRRRRAALRTSARWPSAPRSEFVRDLGYYVCDLQRPQPPRPRPLGAHARRRRAGPRWLYSTRRRRRAPRPCSSSPSDAARPTTTATARSRRDCSPRPSPARAGRSPRLLDGMGERARLLLRLDQPGPPGPLVRGPGGAGRRRRATAPPPPRARAPAWPWSAPTCWPASWPRRPATTVPASPLRAADAPVRRSATRSSARPTSSGWCCAERSALAHHQAAVGAQPPARQGALMAKVIEPIHRAANAITLPSY